MQNYSKNTCDNVFVFPVTDSNVLDPGPGFEYYPQATVIASSVEGDTSCHNDGTWFDQWMCSSDITHI